MTDFLNEVAEDCRAAEEDLGQPTMVWHDGTRNVTATVAGTLTKRGAILVIGGKEVEITLTIRVRWSGTNAAGVAWLFTEAVKPKSGDRITHKGKPYRIAQVGDAHGAFLEIDLIDVNR